MKYRTSGKQVIVETPRWPLAHVADASDEQTAERIVEALNLLAEIEDHRRNALRTIPDSEILTRAREAAIKHTRPEVDAVVEDIRSGGWDESGAVAIAIIALRDLAKPIEEIAPAVDPDLIEARKVAAEVCAWRDFSGLSGLILAGEQDKSDQVECSLAAIRRGRELGRQSHGKDQA